MTQVHNAISRQQDSAAAGREPGTAPAGFVGCNTCAQIARADGQFGGFHNCTAVVCVMPD
jgi:hypothetical protein